MFARCVTGALPATSVGFRRAGVIGFGPPLAGSRNQAACTFGFRALRLLLSPPARGARIETTVVSFVHRMSTSPPARGARIETISKKQVTAPSAVAPRAGGED